MASKTKKSPKGKKYLVIVESPAKAKTIEKYLGKDYKVLASMGHLRDLPKSKIGVDVENNFEPHYIIIKGKAKILKELKQMAEKAQIVFLAPDPDREGEAIAWHLAFALNIDAGKMRRVEFNEITKTAVQQALEHPRDINQNRVDAQQARRILDRLVGYSLSPLLWKKIRRGLSAGRVQSVAVRMLCDRQQEIQAFIPDEYWTLPVELQTQDGQHFKALVQSKLSAPDEKLSVKNQTEATQIQNELEKAIFKVKEVRRKERRLSPAPPFITSTLQQEASRKLGFGARKTMMMAQQLYEGIDLGGGERTGLISYMRTDSTRLSNEALDHARKYIAEHYPPEFLPEKPQIYKSKKSAQDAHEAIRPSQSDLHPESVRNFLSLDQYKVYQLIWNRFIASQMNPAILDQTSIDIEAGNWQLRSSGSIIKFSGFKTLYMESEDQENPEQENILPLLSAGEIVKKINILPEQHFTQPPAHYSEASLIKALEELGIGRPSTYAPTISTIIERNYVLREQKKLTPTDLGKMVNDKLMLHFPDIVDLDFTAQVEEKLDLVEEGQQNWQKILMDFYKPFAEEVKKAETEMESMKVPDRMTDELCEKCGKPMMIKTGRFGEFLACSGFPDCKNTKTIIKPLSAPCPKCQGPLVKKRTQKYRFFVGCSNYPKCDFASWDDPLPGEYCPTCHAFMVMKKIKGQEAQKLCIMCDIKNKESTEKQDEPTTTAA